MSAGCDSSQDISQMFAFEAMKAFAVSEEGATIKLDGSIVGTSPVGALEVVALEESRLEVLLRPSEAYKLTRAGGARARRPRLATGVGEHNT